MGADCHPGSLFICFPWNYITKIPELQFSVINLYLVQTVLDTLIFERAIVEEINGNPFNNIHCCLMYVYLFLKQNLDMVGGTVNQREHTVYFVL